MRVRTRSLASLGVFVCECVCVCVRAARARVCVYIIVFLKHALIKGYSQTNQMAVLDAICSTLVQHDAPCIDNPHYTIVIQQR